MLFGLNKFGEKNDAAAKRVAVRFDPHPQTCTMTLAYARPQGSEETIMPGWHGEYYYLRHHELTSSGCEIKAGNIFDGAR